MEKFIREITSSDRPIYMAALGRVEDAVTYNRFGENDTVGTVEETVWDSGGDYPVDATPGSATLVSSSASDTSQVIVLYVDSEWKEHTEIVALNGLTPVVIDTDVKHVYRMSMYDTPAVGTITATLDSSTVAQILPSRNQTLMAVHVIPAGKTGLILAGTAAVGSGKTATITFRARTEDKVFRTVHAANLYQNQYTYVFHAPAAIPEKSIVELRAVSSASGTPVTAAFDLIVVNNEG